MPGPLVSEARPHVTRVTFCRGTLSGKGEQMGWDRH
jgi:hypothetical protein